MGVTFVTALYLPSGPLYKTLTAYVKLFKLMAVTGVPIILYLDTRLTDLGKQLCEGYTNIQCFFSTFDTSFVPADVTLPANRNFEKDTADYMCIQLSKLKLLRDATAYAKTTHLAWIDFGIYQMFKDHVLCHYWLNKIAYSEFQTNKIVSPSCYTLEAVKPFDNIYWNHSGSFLLGQRDQFGPAYDAQMGLVRANLPRLTWEVNYWTMMPDHFECYYGPHSDLILENVCAYIKTEQ